MTAETAGVGGGGSRVSVRECACVDKPCFSALCTHFKTELFIWHVCLPQVRREVVFSTDTQELEAALQDLEEVRDRVTEQLERDRTAAVELERDRGAELELERDRAAAAAEEEMERGRAAIEKLERDMTEVAAVVEQEMARTAVAVEEEMDRAAELELERDRAAVAAAAEELERARAAAEELVRERTAVSSEEALDVDKAALVELEMEITVVEEISYRAEEVDVIPVPRLSEEQSQPQTESSNMDTEVRECPYSHRPPESRVCMADYHLIRMLMTSRSGD